MATGITYDMMRNMGYPMDSVHLVLHADSTFAVDHLPDCIEDDFGRTLHKQLLVGEGRWKVYQNWRSLETGIGFHEAGFIRS